MINQKNILGVYSDSTFNHLELSMISTDGIDIFDNPYTLVRPYPADLKDDLYTFILKKDFTNFEQINTLEKQVTAFHIDCITEFLNINELKPKNIDAIGYSGVVLYQNTDEKKCVSIGNAKTIANTFKTDVIHRFIQSDLSAGGLGGPLFTSFYDALTRNEQKPLAVISLGGFTNINVIDDFGQVQGFDIGIGTTLLDHWVYKKTGAEMDFDGQLGAKGKVDEKVLNILLNTDFLLQHPPKTSNKDNLTDLFNQIVGLSTPDGAATITAYIAKSIKQSLSFLTTIPQNYILIGGGIKNPTLVRYIHQELKTIKTSTDLNWPTDTLNAQSYAFLASRRQTTLPISFPTTTGVNEPTTGGEIVTFD